MVIAVVGWGSLIWCPGSLRIVSRWRRDGPRLPIEFARISSDGRLTLVIHPDSEDQQTYWAVSEFAVMDQARRNLAQREGAKLSDIHHLARKGQARSGASKVVMTRTREWLAKHREVEGVIWTGLGSNWKDKRKQPFTPDDAVTYLADAMLSPTLFESGPSTGGVPCT